MLLLGIFFFYLPIAHVASIQSILLSLFILYFFIKNYKNIPFKKLFFYKNIIASFAILLLLAIISLYYTPDLKESLKEIKSELIRNVFLMIVLFLYTLTQKTKKIIIILYIIALILSIHTVINISIWYTHGMWPYRAGGLLDSGGGERFGIWATYALSISIAIFFTKYKKTAFTLFIFSIVSIVANQTRATFVATILISIVFFIFFIQNKKIKLFFLISAFMVLGIFYNYSKSFTKRYDIQHITSNFEKIINTSPSKFQTINIEGSTLARLSMWKSVVLYRLKKPFVPTGYGRFLYGRSIKKTFKNSPENLPYIFFAQTHNDYIGILYSLGIIGLIVFIYLFYYELKISYSIFKISDNIYFKAYGVFIFLGTIGFMVSMMFGSFFGDSETKFFYPLYGILLGIYYNEKNILYKSK